MELIFTELLQQMNRHRDTVLVTIVDDQGSAPRGTGSQMLVGADGRLVGSIGGGSVENTSVELAQEVLCKHTSLLHIFSLYQNNREDIHMLCGGDVTLWFQFIPAGDEVWKDLAVCAVERIHQALPARFVLDLSGGPPSLLDPEGHVLAGNGFDLTELNSEVYFSMPLALGERAVIFGAGHISRALVPLLKTVGFRPVVFDCRPDYAVPSLFPDAEAVVCGDFLRIDETFSLTSEDYIVVMTHGHTHDFEVEAQVLRREFAYIGVIGSSKKTAAVNQRLLDAGISEDAILCVHAPIGTAIKAVTPEEIAVSIVGEMIYERAVRRERVEEPHCPVIV